MATLAGVGRDRLITAFHVVRAAPVVVEDLIVIVRTKKARRCLQKPCRAVYIQCADLSLRCQSALRAVQVMIAFPSVGTCPWVGRAADGTRECETDALRSQCATVETRPNALVVDVDGFVIVVYGILIRLAASDFPVVAKLIRVHTSTGITCWVASL